MSAPTATLPPELRLTHLRQLEAEAIHIMREVVAEFENPDMLWSMGKDSSVLLRLAQKAFSPGPIPFPLMHVDTGSKFPEMSEFRQRIADQEGFRLIVESSERALAGRPDERHGVRVEPLRLGVKVWHLVLTPAAAPGSRILTRARLC